MEAVLLSLEEAYGELAQATLASASIEAPPYEMDEEEVPPEQRQSLALSVFEMKDGSFAYTAATGAVFRNSAGKNHVSQPPDWD